MAKVEQILPVQGDVLIIDKALSSNYIKVDDPSKIDYIRSNVYNLIVKGDITIQSPQDLTPGIEYTLILKQDSTGNHTVSFDNKFVIPSGFEVLKTANSITILTVLSDGEKLYIKNQYTSGTGAQTPRTGVDFNSSTGMQLDNILGTWYNKLTQAGVLNITIASGSVISGFAIQPIQVNGNAINITGATKHPDSKDASTTNGATDQYRFWKEQSTAVNINGIYYSITNLGQ